MGVQGDEGGRQAHPQSAVGTPLSTSPARPSFSRLCLAPPAPHARGYISTDSTPRHRSAFAALISLARGYFLAPLRTYKTRTILSECCLLWAELREGRA